MVKSRDWILVIIVFSQFACTSLWFASNAVMPALIQEFNFALSDLGSITSAVQFGFIVGTLSYALLTLADRFSPSKVFFLSAVAAATFNLGLSWGEHSVMSVLGLRFACGFFLAGIYPVGMKIASDYFETGLGKALGYLVGALVLGTAFPHLLNSLELNFSWRFTFFITSALALSGGLLVWLLVPNGPYRKLSQKLKWSALFSIFKNRKFRMASWGYFGHMWELYAFWAFIPVLLLHYQQLQQQALRVSVISFFTIAIGGLACVISGWASQQYGSKVAASISLLGSGVCCLLSPLAFYMPPALLLIFLLIWGMLVVADSPQFSALVARHAPASNRGTALTIVNSIGFSITIISIQLLSLLLHHLEIHFLFLVLVAGPLVGLAAMHRFGKEEF